MGYRVRFESAGGRATRLWFVTEGVLGRQLARDPFLEEVGVLILDEFHERHLPGDVALAAARELQATVRPDLKLVVMSATLDTAVLATYLGDATVLTSEGRAFPVRIDHADAPDARPLAARVAAALASLLAAGDDDGGDVLVFLPGAAAIRRVDEAIARRWRGRAASTCCRCTATCRSMSSAGSCSRARGGAWCSPPTSPRPRSPSPASAP
ncbi:MAG: hypothetical protein U0802_01955 [Candidatus Binatia bacterium]